jgi:hypothetical protein
MKSPNLDNVIHLELRNKHGHKLTNKKLQSISNSLEIDFDQLQMLNDTYSKLWFMKVGFRMELICGVYDGSDKLYFFSDYEKVSPDRILSIKPTEIINNPKEIKVLPKIPTIVEVKPKKTQPEVLEMDAILDKINEMGMDSLTVKELEYLKSLSK